MGLRLVRRSDLFSLSTSFGFGYKTGLFRNIITSVTDPDLHIIRFLLKPGSALGLIFVTRIRIHVQNADQDSDPKS
jgi:hypothetical protein